MPNYRFAKTIDNFLYIVSFKTPCRQEILSRLVTKYNLLKNLGKYLSQNL